MEVESEIVSVSLLNQDQDCQILLRLHDKSKKIFKIITPKNTKKIQFKTYNRKEKSLEELSKKFINCLINYDERIICLDQITKELGVERRRIYDIINILESLQVVQRKCKNKYTWNGFKTIYSTIQQYANDTIDTNSHKREKSLEVLSTGFIKLFMQQKTIWTLEDAAKSLGSATEDDQNKLKTKVRRLYDIANVLKSIGLIRKTQILNTKKPAFEWVGCGGLQQYHAKICKIPEEVKPKQMGFSHFVGKCMDFVLHQKQLTERKQVTEQKIRDPSTILSSITPKLRRTFTIIPPRMTTPKKYVNTPKKNSSKENTPNKVVFGSLIGKFNQNV